MTTFTDSATTALQLIASLDATLLAIVGRSLSVSAMACALACTLGLGLGAWLGAVRFTGRDALLALLNTLLAVPSVVIGLVVYLVLSRSGPLGFLGWLFSIKAMVLAQALLVLPVVTALTRQCVEDAQNQHGEQIESLGATPLMRSLLLAWDERYALLTVLIASFGRAVSEVGAVMVVGGNIDGFTRVMTTAIALETSKGDLPLALALGLILMAVVLVLNALVAGVKWWRQRVEASQGASPHPSPPPAGEGGKVEGGKVEGGKVEGGKVEGGKVEGGKVEGGKVEGGKVEGGKAEGGKAEGGKVEGGKAEGGKAERGKAEGGKAEGGKAEGGKASADGQGAAVLSPSPAGGGQGWGLPPLSPFAHTLSVSQACLRYNPRSPAVLMDITLRIAQGERVALIGSNGSGKSSLLRLLHGLIRPSLGTLESHPGLRQAMLFQHPYLMRTSCLNNVAAALWLRGTPWRTARRLALDGLRRVGLADLARHAAKTLSGGQQQRLALARAWVLQPDVLLLDEPTASLDPHAKREVEALLAELALARTGQGSHPITLIFASHNLGQVKRLATRVIYLEQGRVLADLPVTEFFEGAMLQAHYPQAHFFVKGEH